MTEVLTGEVIDADDMDDPSDVKGPRLTLQQVERALRLSRGNQARAARRLNTTRQAIQNWKLRHPHLAGVIAEARDSLVDMAEDNLRLALAKGEVWATELTLMTLGKNRGYTRRMELTPTTPLQVQLSDADYAMA